MGSGRIEPGRFRVGSDRTAAGPNSLSLRSSVFCFNLV